MDYIVYFFFHKSAIIFFFNSLVLCLVLCIISTVYARNLRCPGNLNTDEVVANSYDSTKYFECTAQGLLEEKQCESGFEFDPIRLVCFYYKFNQKLFCGKL